MTSLRLLADDLTGALDTAAEFVGLCGPIEVGWTGSLPASPPQNLAVDTGTRERSREQVVEIVSGLASLLQGATIAYKKVDSLMRGFWALELAAFLQTGAWRHCIVAPAFPYQGRCTQGGRQYARALDGTWSEVSSDLAATLRNEGLPAVHASSGTDLADGISVFDAETEADLDFVVAVGRSAREPVLWCGSGGLARALARGHEVVASSKLKHPVLGLLGSDQPATLAQLAACEVHWIKIHDGRDDLLAIKRRLAEAGVALVSLDLPPGTSQVDAAHRIRETLGRAAVSLPAPGTLIVAGGETLKGLCASIGTTSLLAVGQIAPGMPRSVVQGGVWDGAEVVSKSGAFGPATLWRDLLIENGLIVEGNEP